MAVTLRDVARHSGVSPRTVSNVVNDFPYISPAMRAKVEAATSELNYKPNLLARSLRKGRTGFIMLLLPEIASPTSVSSHTRSSSAPVNWATPS